MDLGAADDARKDDWYGMVALFPPCHVQAGQREWVFKMSSPKTCGKGPRSVETSSFFHMTLQGQRKYKFQTYFMWHSGKGNLEISNLIPLISLSSSDY